MVIPTTAQGLGVPGRSDTKDTDTKRVMQPLPGRHQRQRREGEILLVLPSSWLSLLSGKPCRTPADTGAQGNLPALPSKGEQGRVRNGSENTQAMVWSATKGRCFRDDANFVHPLSH